MVSFFDSIRNWFRDVFNQRPRASDGGLAKSVGQVLKKSPEPVVNPPPAAKTEPVTTESADTPWMRIARAEIGVKEVPGSGSNPRVQEYHSVTKGGASPDATPWCASFANWVLYKAGIRGTGTKWARDFLNWGEPLYKPRYGCIAVYERNGPGGASHVCFFSEAGESYDHCLGGNQDDAVNVKPQLRSRLLGYRWPKASDFYVQVGAPPQPITTGRDADEGTPAWYRRMFAACEIDRGYEGPVAKDVGLILSGETRYRSVEEKTGVPWWIIGCIHFKEATCDFTAILHSGERGIIGAEAMKAHRRSTIVPKGVGPFPTWEAAAIDALNGARWQKIKAGARDIGEILRVCEAYNGSGYISGAGRAENSPYLWARSNINDDNGKYVRDGVFDPTATTQKTTGLAVLIKELHRAGKIEIEI